MATVLITGANKGIGLELSRQLRERGDDIIALCRKSSPELEALGVRLFEKVDVTDQAALEAVSQELGDTRIDVLINNAGIFGNESVRRPRLRPNPGAVRSQRPGRPAGHVDPVPSSEKGSKIILITSRMGSIRGQRLW